MRSGVVCAISAGALSRSPLAVFGQGGARANPHLDFQIPYEATANPVFYFNRATFNPYVGGVFSAPGVAGRDVQLELVEIRDYAPSAQTRLMTCSHRRSDCFALQFRADGRLRELTTIHTMEHAALGKFDMFVTGTQVQGVWFYEAVVNHAAS